MMDNFPDCSGALKNLFERLEISKSGEEGCDGCMVGGTKCENLCVTC